MDQKVDIVAFGDGDFEFEKGLHEAFCELTGLEPDFASFACGLNCWMMAAFGSGEIIDPAMMETPEGYEGKSEPIWKEGDIRLVRFSGGSLLVTNGWALSPNCYDDLLPEALYEGYVKCFKDVLAKIPDEQDFRNAFNFMIEVYKAGKKMPDLRA